MRLRLILPRVEPTEITPPLICPYEDCEGRHFELHQKVDKAIRDTVYDDVIAYRYECLRCKRTFRVYPQGVTRAQTSLLTRSSTSAYTQFSSAVMGCGSVTWAGTPKKSSANDEVGSRRS